MNHLFFHAAFPAAISRAAGLSLFIPFVLIIAGMTLGFQGIREIRQSHGQLGGAGRAVFAAGLFPSVVILIVCGGGLPMLVEELVPSARARSESWVVVGIAAGLWLCFLMLRGMYRDATGTKPVRDAASAAQSRSGLSTAAIILTVFGCALSLLLLTAPRWLPSRVTGPGMTNQQLVLVTLATLVAATTCGILSRHDSAGRTCAWISGTVFLVMMVVIAG